MHRRFSKAVSVAAALTVFAAASYSREKKESDSAHKIVRFGDLKSIPIMKGCDLAAVRALSERLAGGVISVALP